MRRKHIAPILAAALTGLVALSGCQGGSQGDSGGRSHSFIIGAGEVDGLDPVQTKTMTAQMVVANLYANLIEQKMVPVADGYLDGTEEYVNSIVKSYETSADGKVLTFTLADGLTFADGSPLTADDVVYTMKRTLSDASYVSGSSTVFMHISDAEKQIVAVDPATVRVTLDSPAPALNAFLALSTFGILNAEKGTANAGANGAATEFFVKNATPSGPFTLESWNAGESVKLAKNPKYVHAGDVYPEQLTILNMADEDQRYLALKNGDIDVALDLSPRLVKEASSEPALTVHSMPSNTLYYLGMNAKVAPFDNKLVRQAVAAAVPYELLMQEVLLGQASPAYGVVPHNMATSTAPSETATQYQTDPQRAKQLLAQAGVSNLTVDLSISSADPISVDSAVHIQTALAQAGIKVQIKQLADADFETKSKAQELGFFVANWASWVQDPFFQMRALLLTDRATNRTGFANAEFDKLVLDGIAEGDKARRDELSAQAQRIVVDEASFVGLFTKNLTVVTRSDVDGITLADDQLLRLKYLSRK